MDTYHTHCTFSSLRRQPHSSVIDLNFGGSESNFRGAARGNDSFDWFGSRPLYFFCEFLCRNNIKGTDFKFGKGVFPSVFVCIVVLIIIYVILFNVIELKDPFAFHDPMKLLLSI